MRIAVMGTGALGGFYGGLMARAGHDVTFIARGRTLDALRRDGLTVTSRLAGDFRVPVTATDDPAGMPPVDLVFFSVKAYDLDAAAMLIRPLVGPTTTVLPVQNGIDSEERLSHIVGAQAVVGCAVYVSCTVAAPGVVTQIGGPGLVRVGELTGGRTPRLEGLAALFEGTGVPAEIHDDVRVPLWEKFVTICAMSGVSALTRLTLRHIFACPETRTLYRDVMAEVAAVGRAHGVDLAYDVADGVMRMLLTMEALPERGSMAYDLLAGRRLELETLNGTVVRLGAEAGVPTPCNAVVYAALKPFADGPPDTA